MGPRPQTPDTPQTEGRGSSEGDGTPGDVWVHKKIGKVVYWNRTKIFLENLVIISTILSDVFSTTVD